MKVVPFPSRFAVMSVSEGLRGLADCIDEGLYGDVHGFVFVMNSELEGLEVGLVGQAAEQGPVAHYLLCLGQRKLEDVFGK